MPERALALACIHYRSIARRRARRITEWNDADRPDTQSPSRPRRADRRSKPCPAPGVVDWAHGETRRNDGLWSLAPATAESGRIAVRLFVAGIAREGRATHIEEDADVAAQALDAGCRWIASHNLDLLQGPAFERWLTDEQAQGRLRAASAPFVCAIDDAFDQMLETESECPDGREALASLAWEVTRPDNPDAARDTEARIRTVRRFTDALNGGGAVRAARFIHNILRDGRNDPERLRSRLERRGLHHVLDRTRTAERRQVHASRTTIEALALKRVDCGRGRNTTVSDLPARTVA